MKPSKDSVWARGWSAVGGVIHEFTGPIQAQRRLEAGKDKKLRAAGGGVCRRREGLGVAYLAAGDSLGGWGGVGADNVVELAGVGVCGAPEGAVQNKAAGAREDEARGAGEQNVTHGGGLGGCG